MGSSSLPKPHPVRALGAGVFKTVEQLYWDHEVNLDKPMIPSRGYGTCSRARKIGVDVAVRWRDRPHDGFREDSDLAIWIARAVQEAYDQGHRDAKLQTSAKLLAVLDLPVPTE